jgi:hypothetical protein
MLVNGWRYVLKKAVIVLAALMVVAAPAFAYVQQGSLGSTTKIKDGPHPKEQSDGAGGSTYEPNRDDIPVGIQPAEETVKPVPEPATMAMASMGLLAVGAALRKRRSR